jgi:hypothetical protein
MKADKVLAWIRRGKNVPPTPWWKRPIERVSALRSSSSGSKLPDREAVASKLPDPGAVASNRWARRAAAAGATTAAMVVVVRRRRRAADDATEASETSDATDPSQTPGIAADPSESARAAEEGSGGTTLPDVQAGAEDRTET